MLRGWVLNHSVGSLKGVVQGCRPRLSGLPPCRDSMERGMLHLRGRVMHTARNSEGTKLFIRLELVALFPLGQSEGGSKQMRSHSCRLLQTASERNPGMGESHSGRRHVFRGLLHVQMQRRELRNLPVRGRWEQVWRNT